MPSRRQFLQQASTAALALLFQHTVRAPCVGAEQRQPQIKPSAFLSTAAAVSLLWTATLFGSFLEQLGRAIYEGIYDPGSKLSDSNGFRKDVMQEVRTSWRSDYSISRRQLRFRLQLARRRWPEAGPAACAR